ncbi:MAG: proteasome-type protease [Sneathiellaceae bacterium]
MTYCVGMLVRDGLIALADTRTNAGVDHVSSVTKLHVWEEPGERVLMLMVAGNLAITQSVVSLLDEGGAGDAGVTLMNVPTMFEAARLVGAAVREIHRRDADELARQGVEFGASFLLGGQIAGRRLRLFMVYTAGNFIEATPETPYLQIGETKYGKPIIDRVLTFETGLRQALKCALLSMDSTLKSNISVGLPLDLAIYERDSLRLGLQRRITEEDGYFGGLRAQWREGLNAAVANIPDPDWTW